MKTLLMLVLALAMVLSQNAFAGDAYGTVKLLMAHEPNVVIFTVGNHTNAPACSTQGADWPLSVDTSAGKAMHALLLTAISTGKPVAIHGANDCSAWGDPHGSPHLGSAIMPNVCDFESDVLPG